MDRHNALRCCDLRGGSHRQFVGIASLYAPDPDGLKLPSGRCSRDSFDCFGDPGWIRTSDPQLRRLVLYPAELRGLALRPKVYPRRGRIERCARQLCAANLCRHDRDCRFDLRRPVAGLPARRAVARRGGARLSGPHRCVTRRSMPSCRSSRSACWRRPRNREARWRAGKPLGADRRRSGLDQGQYLGQGPGRPGAVRKPATQRRRRTMRRRSRGCASRAPSSSARPACPSTAGSASATRR